jgi:hypothetical protein
MGKAMTNGKSNNENIMQGRKHIWNQAQLKKSLSLPKKRKDLKYNSLGHVIEEAKSMIQ